jgi:hypothetical protein
MLPTHLVHAISTVLISLANVALFGSGTTRTEQGRVRLDFLLDIFPSDFTIPENLREKSATDGLAAMDWNDGAPAIGVTKEVVASLDSNEVKPKATECLD